MTKFPAMILLVVCAQHSLAQTYRPIPVTGFNHDVIAEGTNKNTIATTSREMDAFDPSNYVLCSKQFAKANGMPSSSGLPESRVISGSGRSFVMEAYNRNNALYLLKRESGTLRLQQPATFESIAILGLATEGQVQVTVSLNFTDGTSSSNIVSFSDWFGGEDAVVRGVGRVKRVDGSIAMSVPFEAPPDNPRIYFYDLPCDQDKKLISITFSNGSPGSNKAGNRAFIFAVSGVVPEPPPAAVKPVVVKKETPVVKIPPPVVVPPKTKKDSVVEVKVPPKPTTPHALGVVLDSKTNGPVKATVTFSATPMIMATTSVTGAYDIEINAAEYTVKVEAPGYLSVLQKVTVSNTGANQFNFRLEPVTVGTLVNLKNVLFKVSTPTLLEESFPELNMVADMMKNSPNMTIELAGHTDNVGAQSLNLKLSNERVDAVRKYLVERGIDQNRITGKGHGGSKPLSKDKSEAGRKLNRRVEFVVTKM